LTSPQETDITTSSNGAVSTRAALVAIDRNSWSRSVGMLGRDRRYAQRLSELAQLLGASRPKVNATLGELESTGAGSMSQIANRSLAAFAIHDEASGSGNGGWQ
jgi:hypothetical protein